MAERSRSEGILGIRRLPIPSATPSTKTFRDRLDWESWCGGPRIWSRLRTTSVESVIRASILRNPETQDDRQSARLGARLSILAKYDRASDRIRGSLPAHAFRSNGVEALDYVLTIRSQATNVIAFDPNSGVAHTLHCIR